MIAELMTGGDVQETGAVWRVPAVRALLAASVLGFTSYAATLSALPSYAVRSGAGGGGRGAPPETTVGSSGDMGSICRCRRDWQGAPLSP